MQTFICCGWTQVVSKVTDKSITIYQNKSAVNSKIVPPQLVCTLLAYTSGNNIVVAPVSDMS